MDNEIKKVLVQMASVIFLVAVFVYVHEYGHYSVANRFDLNPEMHFLRSSGNESGFARFWAYTRHDAAPDLESDRMVLIGGLSANLIFLAILSIIGLVYALYTDNKVLAAILAVLVVGLLCLVLEWNLFRIVEGSDLYYLLYTR